MHSFLGIFLSAQHPRLIFLGSRGQKNVIPGHVLEERKAEASVHAAMEPPLAHSFLHTLPLTFPLPKVPYLFLSFPPGEILTYSFSLDENTSLLESRAFFISALCSLTCCSELHYNN